ncbi:hypothetical protein OpiT1DRAFT_01263 [Opitutaceae bacterium TAV1]|nr:hypothetical protein OpiT1DRAFT_01263 [Opitutaceae bacterium TAV1]
MKKPQTTKPKTDLQYRGELIPDLASRTQPETAATVAAHLAVYSKMRATAHKLAKAAEAEASYGVDAEAARNWCAILDTLVAGMIDAREQIETQLYLRRVPVVSQAATAKLGKGKGAPRK